MQYFPLFMDLNNKPVLVVGGGEVASRKVESLVRAGANVTIVSPVISETLKQLVKDEKCDWQKRKYQSEVVTKFVQVWATTNNSDLNHKVYQDAKQKNILVNVVDDKPYCDFITPSMINRGKIQVAISSGGASPVLVRKIREQLEVSLPQNIAMLADFAQLKRDEIKKNYATVEERRLFWERFFFRPEIEQVTTVTALDELYNNGLADSEKVTLSLCFIEYSNDVEMLSIKALREMQKTELVLFTSGCPFEFVDLCRRDAERVQYADSVDLNTKMNQRLAECYNSICIFIQKDKWRNEPGMEELVSKGQLLKIVE
ncbi:NAD(P)-dependent oxidoreductase [Vibrio hannami]|uniref:precorrin-2 dehydrogenase/sirohydrochlorin ferrochelatase family protein n=1 Tax=Vibrio hannami TaxID=2717094 RepID=UPI0024103596|nr:NAD(P)-dependent oxidoreductase [Vibrio hannami]MDG3088080.1 NAD(P)-dependent oxidoreductase [Vibrio hannami]